MSWQSKSTALAIVSQSCTTLLAPTVLQHGQSATNNALTGVRHAMAQGSVLNYMDEWSDPTDRNVLSYDTAAGGLL
jgi:hypothetical protein